MAEPKFKRGDIVKHKSSGETAVVVSTLVWCTDPNHTIHISGFYPDCKLEFSGSYQLDTGSIRRQLNTQKTY